MTDRAEGVMAIVAALVVLFSTMWDPRVSAVVAIVLLVAFSVYKFLPHGKER